MGQYRTDRDSDRFCQWFELKRRGVEFTQSWHSERTPAYHVLYWEFWGCGLRSDLVVVGNDPPVWCQSHVNHMSMWWDQLHQALPTWVGCWCEFCHRASSLSSLFFTERMQWSTVTETILGGTSNPGPFPWIRFSSILNRSLPSDPCSYRRAFFQRNVLTVQKHFLCYSSQQKLFRVMFQ